MTNLVFMKNHSNKIAFILALPMLLLWSCGHSNQTSENTESTMEEETISLSQEQFQNGKMQWGTISEHSFYNQVKTSGYFEVPPAEKVSISSFMGGSVNHLSIHEGKSVEAGDLLFTLVTPEFIKMQQDYVETLNQIEFLEKEYERQKKLYEDKVASEKDFQQIKSNYLITKAKLNGFNQTFKILQVNPKPIANGEIQEELKFYAPISGTIISVAINRGAYLSPETIALTLINTQHMQLRLRVFENDISKIAMGQKVSFYLQDNTTKKYEGKITAINKQISESNGAVHVYATFGGALLPKIIPGMYVNAYIITESESKPALPAHTLVMIDDVNYVLTQNAQTDQGFTLKQKVVKAGRSDDQFVEILNTSDFAPNTQFLTEGAFNLIQE